MPNYQGIGLALVATAAYNTGFVLEKRALGSLPSINVRKPKQLIGTLFTAPGWLVGFVCMLFGLGCQLVVLGMLPITVAQPLQAGGIPVLTLMAWLVLGERPHTRDWWRLGAVSGAILLLGLSIDGATRPGTTAADPVPVAVVVLLAVVATGVLYVTSFPRRAGRHRVRAHGISAGMATGLVYGLSGLGMKGLSIGFGHGSAGSLLTSPYLYLTGLSSVAGMVMFQTALQRYRASVVIPTSNVVGSAYVLLCGTLLFHETLPPEPIRLTLRAAGLLVAVLALAIQPDTAPDSGPGYYLDPCPPRWKESPHVTRRPVARHSRLSRRQRRAAVLRR